MTQNSFAGTPAVGQPAETYERATFEFDTRLKPLFDQWRRSDYWQRRLLRKNIPDGPPRFLYKYHGFDGAYDRTNLYNWIVLSAFRLSRPIEFNDPFDFHGTIVAEGSKEEIAARCNSIARNHAPRGATEEQIRRIADFLAANIDQVIRLGQESFARVRTTTGVACFSTDHKTILLWSHYGAGHTGVCLQFDVAHALPDFSPAVTVRIVSGLKLPTINWVATLQKDIAHVMLQKNSWWEYERERRIIEPDQAGKYVFFQPQSLARIILGCRIRKADIQFVDDLLAERAARRLPPIEVYVASPHGKLAKLVVRKRPAPT